MIAVYVRVSSRQQEEANGTQSQEGAIRAYLDRLGIAGERWYAEDGAKSARSTKGREAYLRLLADIERGEVKEVVAFSLSRLSRSVGDAAAYIRLTVEKGVRTTFVSDGFVIDPASPFSKAMAQIAAVFAELDNDIRRSNTKAGIAAYRAKGNAWGGERRRKIDGERAATLAKDGQSTATIAESLGVNERTVRRELRRRGVRPARRARPATLPA